MTTRDEAFARMQAASQALTDAIYSLGFTGTTEERAAYDARVSEAEQAHREASRAYDVAKSAQKAVNEAFSALRIDARPWRTDDDATHRIGSVDVFDAYDGNTYATVYVSDMRQGHGQYVPIGQANPDDLAVRVSTRRKLIVRDHVTAADLATVLHEALREVRSRR